MDSDFKIMNKAMAIDSLWESKMTNIRPLSIYKDTIYYTTPTNFNIYRYDGKEVTISHTVNFGKCQLPSEQISYDEYKKFCLSPDYITAIRIFQETPNYYLYWLLNQDKIVYVYTTKTIKNLRSVNSHLIPDNISFLLETSLILLKTISLRP